MHKFFTALTRSSDLPVLHCLGLLGVLLKKKGDSLLCPLFQVENRQHVPQISSLASAEEGDREDCPLFSSSLPALSGRRFWRYVTRTYA